MTYIPVEQLLEKAGNSVYKLVILASRRSQELAEGQPKLVNIMDSSLKPSSIALWEIKEGKVKAKIKSKQE
ncbi:MAG: DNA-directed RNA polymerase subunit omega [Candidatus Omnitrophica bacterium]|nr:DNA-directed RNA polymerase subunit omega [Candidatus Omnitrophota bacterium]